MHQWKIIFCILGMMAAISLFCFGCSWTTQETSKGTVIRCPKCGDFYQSREGVETFEHMRGRGATRK